LSKAKHEYEKTLYMLRINNKMQKNNKLDLSLTSSLF